MLTDIKDLLNMPILLKKFFNFGNLTALAGLALSIVALFKAECIGGAIVYVFGFYILLLAVLLVWREYSYSRKARYAEATESIHGAAHHIRDALDSLENEQGATVFKGDIKNALNDFSRAFSIITGANCRSCIKTIVVEQDGEDSRYYVQDLCRMDSGFIKEKINHAINENTDFEALFSNGSNFYFSNNLLKEKVYNNSNWPKTSSEREIFIKEKKYTYLSTLVWPIRGRSNDDTPTLVGFLCVDSLAKGVFDRGYDKDFGAIVADTLYYPLAKYTAICNNDTESPVKGVKKGA